MLRKTPVGYQKQRLTALYLFRSGQATTRKQAAALIGVHRKTIGHWLATYASEGPVTDYISETFDVQMNYKTVHACLAANSSSRLFDKNAKTKT